MIFIRRGRAGVSKRYICAAVTAEALKFGWVGVGGSMIDECTLILQILLLILLKSEGVPRARFLRPWTEADRFECE